MVVSVNSKMTAIADAIRGKTGGTDALTLDAMATEIAGISSGGDTSAEDSLVTRDLTEYSNDRVVVIGSNAFNGCTKLTSVNLPAATSIGSSAFTSCTKLTSVNLPAATSIGDNAFNGCTKLTSVDFPAATSIGSSAFNGCTKLTSVNLPAATSIGSTAFSGCYYLTALILQSGTMCTLKNTNAFRNCFHVLGEAHNTYNPDGLKDGYFYVPSALVANYQAATNWSTYATQFRALEDYTVDGTITGELDPTKI